MRNNECRDGVKYSYPFIVTYLTKDCTIESSRQSFESCANGQRMFLGGAASAISESPNYAPTKAPTSESGLLSTSLFMIIIFSVVCAIIIVGIIVCCWWMSARRVTTPYSPVKASIQMPNQPAARGRPRQNNLVQELSSDVSSCFFFDIFRESM